MTVWCFPAGELDQAALEEECQGNFMELRKSFFLLSGAEVPLVAKVRSCNGNIASDPLGWGGVWGVTYFRQ